MSGEKRREEILKTISSADTPVSGTALAARFHVSRQVIVQDIALLRAANHSIISTNRGYLIQNADTCSCVVCVSHTDEQIEEELNLIVDTGGCVEDIFVEHAVYGRLEAPLPIRSRRDVKNFLADIKDGKASPLKNLTSGVHYHTIRADSAQTLELIKKELSQKGFLKC